MTSFLNMGGSLVDLGTVYQYSEGVFESDQEFYSRSDKVVFDQVSESMGFDSIETVESIARIRRARRAVQLAIILASADGPLPIGDMLAIGVLGAYAGYEVYKTVETFV